MIPMAARTVESTLARTLFLSMSSPAAWANFGLMPPAEIAMPSLDRKNIQTRKAKSPKVRRSPVGMITSPTVNLRKLLSIWAPPTASS